MEISKLKSYTIEQLEQTISAAITSLTNGRVDVTISLIKDVSAQMEWLSAKDKFLIELTAVCQTRPDGEPVKWGDEDKPF